MSPRVALLGLGTMGAGMAHNILEAGLELSVWNRSADKAAPLGEAGATVASTPAEAVEGADVVVTMLFDTASVLEVMTQAASSLGDDAVWVQTSTLGVDGTDAVAAVAAERGVAFVDAPVLGTKGPAESGNLVVLASGEESLQARVAPVLDAIGSRTLWVGPVGSASRLKLVCNAWVLTVVGGIGQSVAMAEAFGLEPQQFLDAIGGGAMDAPYVAMKTKAIVAGDFDPQFAIDGGLKDAGLIADAARQAGLDPRLMDALRHELQVASDAGHGDKDLAATYLAAKA
ncbi:NAD(P)-dependent oxidoreductase [Solicola sp. PLA-1-18]|uniref:NAD(P)-dependent oxidoreductase n=1 Tax=Solicola sp. PLA-1-18 TaxID=3380532 RepID=UPI003B7FAE6B